MTRQARGRTEPDFLYFAYGSNLSEARLRENCPSARLVTVARLSGYRLAFTMRSDNWGGGVADIRPQPEGEVWGAVWCIATDESARLDRQEGVHATPPRYRRIDVAVVTPEGDALECLAYQVVTPATHEIPPSPRYRQTMLRGARACALPPDYVERIAALPDTSTGDGGPA